MKFNLFRYSILFVLLIGLCSWGEKAHQKINGSCVDFFPKELNQLKVWSTVLAEHASDADFRRKSDKNEFVRHFIDMDNYDDFNNKHKIVEDYSATCNKYGKEKVIKNGTLPWVTDSTYKALVRDFKSQNWDQAVLTAADLGHYVGDGFMPLHITANYDGHMTKQDGVHRRYEETMINKYISQINFKASGIKKVTDVKSYIFSYLYKNYSYAEMALQSDKLASRQACMQYSSIYYEFLWGTSNLFTTHLLQESSKTLAILIYTAWLEAGKPQIPESQEKIRYVQSLGAA